MKKLFSFKSSSSPGRERRDASPAGRKKKQNVEMQWKKACAENMEKKFHIPEEFLPVSDRKVTDSKGTQRSFVLRRSRSLTMPLAEDDDRQKFGDEDVNGARSRRRFPSSTCGVSHPSCDCPKCHRQFVDVDPKPDKYDAPRIRIAGAKTLNDSAWPCASHCTSPRSSFGSTSIPSKALDLYIDGEYHQEEGFGVDSLRISSRSRSNSLSTIDFIIPSHETFRGSLRPESSRDQSPSKLARNVVERLLSLEQRRDSKTKEDIPNRAHQNLVPERTEKDTDLELRKTIQEVKERARLLSRKLAPENVSALPQMIRSLIEEQRNLLLELSDQLHFRIAERKDAKDAVSLVKDGMNTIIVKLESEKNELQSQLQEELDRRTDDWVFKFQEINSEEQNLKDRVRELAERNATLQKELSYFYNKEKEYSDMLTKLDDFRSENVGLQKALSDIQDKLKAAEQFQTSADRNCKGIERDNTGLVKTVSRLQGTVSEQEKTIDGLRQSLSLEREKTHMSSDDLDRVFHKLQMEQQRLTGVEQVLRRDLEKSRVETESLRHENIYLLERLQGTGLAGGLSTIKLDKELLCCVEHLQTTGLSLLFENNQMCTKLLGILRGKTTSQTLLEAHILTEYELKVQKLKQGIEQLTRGLGKTSSILKNKSEPEHQLLDTGSDRLQNSNERALEDDLKSELKAEILLTSILKEKMYSKEKEIEQLQSELARALRNHDVLKSEVQDAFDTISCMNHKMKNLELQMIKKDGTINQLQEEIRSHVEQLSTSDGIVSKVTQERDLMWEEVKQYSEKNMLLHREVGSLKKKIEALEEDTLLKDGQISILKDSLNNARSFDVLFGSENGELFKL